MQEFIGEEDLETFEGWLRYQAIDAAALTPEQLKTWQLHFEDSRKRRETSPKVGLMKLKPPIPGEHRYAVAVPDGAKLWLTLWVRRSPKPEFFVMVPQGDRDWDVHSSYHLDGKLHMKSYGRKVLSPQERQPLTGVFRGTQSIGSFAGHAPKGVGAICDPAAFSGVVEVPPGVLGPRHGMVTVDLVEPGCEPTEYPFFRVVTKQVFREALPWVIIMAGYTDPGTI